MLKLRNDMARMIPNSARDDMTPSKIGEIALMMTSSIPPASSGLSSKTRLFESEAFSVIVADWVVLIQMVSITFMEKNYNK